MDFRCPLCGKNLAKRGFSQAVVARMETECPHCKSTLRVNVHPVEMAVVYLVFGGIALLAGLAYWLHGDRLILAAFGVAMLGALALPLLERTFLRSWPRYVRGG